MSDLPNLPNTAGIIKRAKAIIMSPSTEWPKIAGETDAPMPLFLRYVLPLVAIGPIASLLGMMIFGMPTLFGTMRIGMGTMVTMAITNFILALIGVFVIAWAANFLSPKQGGRDDFPAAFRLVAYAMTASWVGAIFGLLPALSIIGLLFSLYSIYLFYKGAQPVMGVPADKGVVYTVLTIVVAVVIQIVISVAAAALTGPSMMAGAGLEMESADGENITIDMGAFGSIESGEDGAVMNIRNQDGEEVTITVEE